MTPIQSRMLRRLLHRSVWYDRARVVKPHCLTVRAISVKVGVPERMAWEWEKAISRWLLEPNHSY